jgi:hypothetical protein
MGTGPGVGHDDVARVRRQRSRCRGARPAAVAGDVEPEGTDGTLPSVDDDRVRRPGGRVEREVLGIDLVAVDAPTHPEPSHRSLESTYTSRSAVSWSSDTVTGSSSGVSNVHDSSGPE